MESVLIVDDDKELCELVGELLREEGFRVETISQSARGLSRALSGDFQMVVLDVMMPGMNGFEVLRQIRGSRDKASRVPVLMLTARGEDVDRIVGLEIGADDYLPKPFNPRELIARINSILRRVRLDAAEPQAQPPEPLPARVEIGDVEIETGIRRVLRAGSRVELTNVEYELLLLLMMSAGNIVKREELARAVLGRDLSPLDRSIDMHISNLRKKLGHRVGEAERIKTVRSVGYIYARPADAQGEKERLGL